MQDLGASQDWSRVLGLFYDDDGMGTIGASICLYYPVAAYCHRFRGSEFRFRVLGFGLGFRV